MPFVCPTVKILCRVTQCRIKQTVCRHAEVNVVLSVLFSSVFAVLCNFTDCRPREKIEAAFSRVHISHRAS